MDEANRLWDSAHHQDQVNNLVTDRRITKESIVVASKHIIKTTQAARPKEYLPLCVWIDKSFKPGMNIISYETKADYSSNYHKRVSGEIAFFFKKLPNPKMFSYMFNDAKISIMNEDGDDITCTEERIYCLGYELKNYGDGNLITIQWTTRA